MGLVVGVWVGECVGCGRVRGEKVSLAPLYYPDTLVNPDTCLGVFYSTLPNKRVVVTKYLLGGLW